MADFCRTCARYSIEPTLDPPCPDCHPTGIPYSMNPHKHEDVIGQAMKLAAERFGGVDGMFNAAGFSNTLGFLTGINGGVDGKLVKAILSGRTDCEHLPGSHYRWLKMEKI